MDLRAQFEQDPVSMRSLRSYLALVMTYPSWSTPQKSRLDTPETSDESASARWTGGGPVEAGACVRTKKKHSVNSTSFYMSMNQPVIYCRYWRTLGLLVGKPNIDRAN